MSEKNYIKVFDEYNQMWTDDREYNIMFIKRVENYINDKLRMLGWVSLNEVYDLLGFPRELEAQVVGWKISNVNDCINYIQFEVFNKGDSDIEIVFLNVVKLL